MKNDFQNEIYTRLNKRAVKRGMALSEYPFEEFPWIKADVCLHLTGMKVDYDISADYGNQYPHDTYIVTGDICREEFGEPDIVYPYNYDRNKWNWGSVYEVWTVGDVIITNYIYGHPRNGFYCNFLYIGDIDMTSDIVE